ncbi:E3 ubiquitin-protein ligase TRIM33-like [Mya arenaria]|uniref:E3 ubiquitin-protein ligase TRIM33-like n=1 Tax=Mya arenaria TaxID=6604 RepID=UPI0022DF97EC|nr:E3 ubiquitin-protein ligase TRIM33-like [Mya arenaria]XP_052818597.1 E3 ubiquitin-protein ligase TRIM33-like [Mya arenaria]
MEVPGKKRDPDFDKGSTGATVFCQPCGEGSKRAVAQGYCQTCEEYMCAPCVEYHKRLKMSRNHILLSKDKMPSFYPSTKKSAIADMDYCNHHPKKMIKFYCPTHGDLGCGDCVVLNHRSCKVDYIAEVAQEFVIGKEFRELEPSIKQAKDLLSGLICNVKEIFGGVENQSKVEIDKLRKFRAEINTYLDRCEKELLDNIEKVKTEDENALTALKTDCELMKSRLDAIRTGLTSGDVSVNQRYVTARRGMKEIRGIHDDMWKMPGRMKARKYQFNKDADTERLLGSKMGIGTLDVAGEFQKNFKTTLHV